MAGGKAKQPADVRKLDRALQHAHAKGDGGKQRVIIRAKAGYETWLRQQLMAQREHITGEYPSIAAMSVELDADTIGRWSLSQAIASISSDPNVSPTAQRNQGNRGNHTHQAKAKKGSAAVAPTNTLLATLGLTPNVAAGQGVTVALIDSGIAPSDSFGSRIKAFYDFTADG